MKITITISTGNDAFKNNPEGEVARILREIANRLTGLAWGCEYNQLPRPLYDRNGNKVGEFATIRGRGEGPRKRPQKKGHDR